MKAARADLQGALRSRYRHALIDLADQLSGEADMRRREEGDPKPFLVRLADFLQDVDHAIIGGLAVRAYTRARPTRDLDVMVSRRGWPALRKFLEGEGGEVDSSVEQTYFYEFPAFDLGLDIRIADSPLDRAALAATVARTFEGRKLRVVKPDHLAAMKVKSFSERKEFPKGAQDRQDVRDLLSAKVTTAVAIRSVLKRNRPDLLAELEGILGK